ncbi:MAG: penicillin-binding protein 2 [Hyphomicrobiales bacterium]|nr:penicillin-binding protein 2 [Hyphomicrobiales bacterium]
MTFARPLACHLTRIAARLTAWRGSLPRTAGGAPSAAASRGDAPAFRLADLFVLRPEKLDPRILLVALVFGALFAVLAGRILSIQLRPDETGTIGRMTSGAISTARPAIIDRHGVMMATDVKTVSIFADPRKVIDKEEAAELINAVFPELDGRELREKLAKKAGFVWIKREATPKQQAEIHRLGIPGLGFLPENKRVYPNGTVGAHVLGFANIDNIGIAGIEKFIDGQGLQDLKGAGFALSAAELKPVELALDVRVTHAVRQELVAAIEKYKAKAAAGLVLDVDTGEIIAHVSLPDYDPNNPADALKPEHINRLQVGVYEMGSTFKALTTAMALDSGKVKLNSSFDARGALRYGRFKINDYHGKNRVLSVPEIFIYSSNIGTARMALAVGVEGHKAFLKKMGQLDRLKTELPESAEPIKPARWGELNTITIAFGHGLAVAPLQSAMAAAALVNGGRLIPPTYLKRSREEAETLATRVIKPETSEMMRYVMRLNAEKGSASKADIPGYYLGGKTGTSEKVIGGRYAKNRLLTAFMAVMPADKPRYILLTMLDEPKGLPETHGYATSGWNAAPVTGRILERIGPMLGIETRFELPAQPFPFVARLGAMPLRQ